MVFFINENMWKVEFVNANDFRLYRSDGSRTVGVADLLSRKIYLSNLLQGGFLRKVLDHELVHAFSLEYNLQLSQETEEKVADFIATYGRSIFDISDEIFAHLTVGKIKEVL